MSKKKGEKKRISNTTKTKCRAIIWLLFNLGISQAPHHSRMTRSPGWTKALECHFFFSGFLKQSSSFSSCSSCGSDIKNNNNNNNTIECWKVCCICIQFCVVCCCALSLFTCPEQWSIFPQMMMSHLEASCSSCAALHGAAVFRSSIMWKIYLLTHKWITYFSSTQD